LIFILDLRCSWVSIWIFQIHSSRYRLSCSSLLVPSFSRPGQTWCRSLPGLSTLALVLSVHPGSLCKDSGRAFNFLHRLACPNAGLGQYLPQVRRVLCRSVFSIDFCCVERRFPYRRPVRTPVPAESAFAWLLGPAPKVFCSISLVHRCATDFLPLSCWSSLRPDPILVKILVCFWLWWPVR
jgi:hypothetical protein